MRHSSVVSLMVAAAAATGLLTAGTAAAVAAPSTALAAKAKPCAGKTKKAAAKAIEASYAMVLDGTVPDRTLDERFAFIEGSEDPALRALLDDIAAKNAAMLATTSVQVNEVTCTAKKRADVLFDLVLSGQPSPGLAPPGSAVLDAKTWKMTGLTVCNLFSLADPTLLESGPCADITLEGT
jgi:hypothetical protein